MSTLITPLNGLLIRCPLCSGFRSQRRRATRRDVRRATLRDANMVVLLSEWRSGPDLCGTRLHAVQMRSLVGGDQADLHEVQRADEAVADAEPARADDRVAQRYRPVVLDQDERGSRVVRDVGEDVPRLLVREHVHAVGGRLLACGRAGLHALLALDPEADQRADRPAELLRLVAGEVAEVLDLQLAVGILVDGERVDDAHGLAGVQALELGDDLAAEVRVLEAQHDQLNGPDRHECSFGMVSMPRSLAARRSRASSELDDVAEGGAHATTTARLAGANSALSRAGRAASPWRATSRRWRVSPGSAASSAAIASSSAQPSVAANGRQASTRAASASAAGRRRPVRPSMSWARMPSRAARNRFSPSSSGSVSLVAPASACRRTRHWTTAITAATSATRACASMSRTSSVPRCGCSRASHHRNPGSGTAPERSMRSIART